MSRRKYRIYMDVCCYNRPFDDLSSDRVRAEADAVLSIVSRCRLGEWTLVDSDVIEREISRQTDVLRREKADALLAIATERLRTSEEAALAAEAFQKAGIGIFDSYHLAVAHKGGCDVFLTTDDRFLKKATVQGLAMVAANPASWILEVI